jgi:histidinol dehydrogenase
MTRSNPPTALLDTRSTDFEARFRSLLERRETQKAQVDEAVERIVQDVRRRGDAAVLDASERFDGYRLHPGELLWGQAEIRAGAARLPAADREALAAAAERISRFHSARVPASWRLEADDESLGQEIRPLESAGLYVPGGSAPLASSALMLGIPARVAGVERRVMASPGRDPHPAVLAAAELSGVTHLARVGGAQAIAALAFGTETIPRVDKIVGPGSAYVQAAKRQVHGVVAIDAEAGPSEVWIVADSSAPPDLVAADLVAQAEHDPLAGVVVASPDLPLLRGVLDRLVPLVDAIPRASIARQALATQGAAVWTRDLAEAIDLGNRYAPEHLQLMVEEPERWLPAVRHAGAVFLGMSSPVPIGDYVAGPNHVLPTGGTARFSSPLGVEDFLRRMSVIRLGPTAIAGCAPHAIRLAELEGLHGHAQALRLRLPARTRGPRD